MYYLYMKVYCPSCGAAVHYTVEKPRFCSKCGDPISIYAKTKQKQPQKNYEFSEDIDIEEDPNESVPQIGKLDIEILPDKIPRHTLGQILESQPSEPPPEMTNNLTPRVDNQTSEEFLQQFGKEAGSIRPNKKDA